MEFKKIYENAFSNNSYNTHTDKEPRFELVKNYVLENNVKTMIDIGSGRGNIIKILNELNFTVDITSTDLTKFHDYDVPFLELNLCDKNSYGSIFDKKYDLLTCLDVLEHIEKNCVNDVFELFSKISKYSLITIANHSDIQDGVELHIIQENMDYWGPIIEKFFVIEDLKTEYHGRLYILKLKSKNYE
jgi:2-polyprenyl-3-methyl-5-hydroxy-6-metoxy-1,4-benzoquinol methylase